MYDINQLKRSLNSAVAVMEAAKEPLIEDVVAGNVKEIIKKDQEIIDVLIETNKQLIKANEIKEKELEDAKKESRSNKRWTMATFIVAVLSLLVAIIPWIIK